MPENLSAGRLSEPDVPTPTASAAPGFPGAVPSPARQDPAPSNHETDHPSSPETPASSSPSPSSPAMRPPHGDSLITRGARALWRTVSTDAFPNDWADAVEICQRPVTTGRRIGVVGPTGGSGASTLTAAMAALLASVRTDEVAAVDLCAAPSGLTARLPSTETGRSLGALASASELPADDVDLAQYGARPQPRLRRLSRSADDAGLQAGQAHALYRSLSRRYAAAICELPRPAAAPEGLSSYGVHALVVALSSAPGDIEVNCETLGRIRRAEPELPLLPVLVDARRHSHRSRRQTRAQVRGALRELGVDEPLRLLDTDRHLAVGGPVSIDRIGEARRLQVAQLTAAGLLRARGDAG